MIAVQWDRKFELGHPRIDTEHRIFLELVQALAAVCAGDGNRPRILRRINEIARYAEFHFVSEENLMEEANYPDLGRHRREHAILLARLNDQVHDFQSGILRAEKIVDFLVEWFALHAAQEDRRLAAHLAGRAA